MIINLNVVKKASPPPPEPYEVQGVGGQRAPAVRSRNHRKNRFSPLPARVQAIFQKILMHLLSKENLSLKGFPSKTIRIVGGVCASASLAGKDSVKGANVAEEFNRLNL